MPLVDARRYSWCGPRQDRQNAVMVEGYTQQGPRGEQYLRSRARALIVRDNVVGTFHLDPQATGAIPLSGDSTGSPGKAPWDGVALAVILPKDALTPRGSR
jgi:hypothetical protein